MMFQSFRCLWSGVSNKTRYFVVAFMLVVLVLWLFRASVVEQLRAYQLLPTDDTFTELYFVDYSAPHTMPAEGDVLTFSFALRNGEGGVQHYYVRSYVETAEGERVQLTELLESLDKNEVRTFTETLIYDDMFASSTFHVTIPALNQSIYTHLLVPE